MLIMQQEGKRLNCVGNMTNQRRLFIHYNLFSNRRSRSGLSIMQFTRHKTSRVMEAIKVNAINKLKVKVVVINGGNMDLGTNRFTSDVSLPKDEGK